MSVVNKMTKRRREEVDVGIQVDWTGREGGRERGEKEMRRIGVCAWGGHGQTIRRRRRLRKIGDAAAGLRARQDYLPSGEHSSFLFREKDT